MSERVLKDQHERFAQAVATGRSALSAYRELYGDSKGIDASASKLLNSARIQSRISELRAETAKFAVLSLAEKREFLRRVVLTPASEVTGSSELCQEVQFTEFGTRCKMPNKLKAIELDAKLAGGMKDVPKVSVEQAE